MTAVAGFRDSRRSTRVPLLVTIEALGIAEPLTCEGETIMVNLHGALISTSVALSAGMKITIHVYLTGKRATAEVVYVDPEKPLRCTFGEYPCLQKTGMKAIRGDAHPKQWWNYEQWNKFGSHAGQPGHRDGVQ
jgi:hypothetical protein